MPEFNIAFAKLSHITPFLHMAATIVFIGFQACFWYMAKFFMKDIEHSQKKITIAVAALKRLGCAVYPSLFVIVITGIFAKSEAKAADPMLNTIIATKWAMFCFLFINVLYVTYRIARTIKNMKNGDTIELCENLIVVIYYFIPLNVVVALFTTYLGVAYGGL